MQNDFKNTLCEITADLEVAGAVVAGVFEVGVGQLVRRGRVQLVRVRRPPHRLLCVCVCVCESVSERERARKRERDRLVALWVGVEKEDGERGRNRERKGEGEGF